MRRQAFTVHPALLGRAPAPVRGGALLLLSILASGAVFAAFVVALTWGFALLEAVLS